MRDRRAAADSHHSLRHCVLYVFIFDVFFLKIQLLRPWFSCMIALVGLSFVAVSCYRRSLLNLKLDRSHALNHGRMFGAGSL